MANVIIETRKVERWFVDGVFNPGSPDQIRAYMEHTGIKGKPGKHSLTDKPSTDENTLKRLVGKDPNGFYRKILEYRKIDKMRGTYVTSNIVRLDLDDRLHPKFLHKPSTWRLSCVDPNWQNIPGRDMEEEDSLSKMFRQCVTAAPGCVIVEIDYSGIEAVETGWFSHDPDYMRLSKYGIHAYLTSHLMGDPADLSWPDKKLGEHLAGIKRDHHDSTGYFAMKRTVHLTNYGGSPWMMQRAEPSVFPTIRSAQESQDFYLNLVPKLKEWQSSLRKRAAKENYLGGASHPFKLKHWFWDVIAYDAKGRQKPGADWNKVVAFYPQSTSACVLYDAVLRLTDPSSDLYVGDLFHGQTPLRALIHDSILAEVPKDKLDVFLDRARRSMLQPICAQPLPSAWGMGENLVIDVGIGVGPSWGEMESV